MPKFNYLPTDMKLYSPMEPKGRVFLAGEQWPGDAWSEKVGGEVSGLKTGRQAIEDLGAAQLQIEQLQDMAASAEHDRAQLAKERDEAVSAIAAVEQRAVDAERAQVEAEAVATSLTAERDHARSVADKAAADLAVAEELIAGQQATLAAQSEEIDALRAEIAKVDGDGDGRVGGRAKKAPADPA